MQCPLLCRAHFMWNRWHIWHTTRLTTNRLIQQNERFFFPLSVKNLQDKKSACFRNKAEKVVSPTYLLNKRTFRAWSTTWVCISHCRFIISVTGKFWHLLYWFWCWWEPSPRQMLLMSVMQAHVEKSARLQPVQQTVSGVQWQAWAQVPWCCLVYSFPPLVGVIFGDARAAAPAHCYRAPPLYFDVMVYGERGKLKMRHALACRSHQKL